jgi:hypothetical protein
MTEFFEADDLIFEYSRAQALSDGELVDVTQVAREAGFRHPMALTRAAWEACVAWSDADEQRTRAAQSESGRLRDLLQMGLHAIRVGDGQEDRCEFTLARIPRDEAQAKREILELVCGPGDAGEPVITVQLPGED